MSDQTAISSMPLYTHLERVERALAALGIGRGDAIRPEQLFAIDQWHYHGTDAIRAAAEALGLGPASRVLDVGSGIGGPARYLAHITGCHVTALELQPELHEIGVDLTRRSGLEGQVTHLCGDALTYPLPLAEFDAVVSWLAILHIADRPRLFARLARALRAGGQCYVEDLSQRAPFAPRDLADLRGIVHGITVTSRGRTMRPIYARRASWRSPRRTSRATGRRTPPSASAPGGRTARPMPAFTAKGPIWRTRNSTPSSRSFTTAAVSAAFVSLRVCRRRRLHDVPLFASAHLSSHTSSIRSPL